MYGCRLQLPNSGSCAILDVVYWGWPEFFKEGFMRPILYYEMCGDIRALGR